MLEALPAASECRDRANWESLTAGSTPGGAWGACGHNTQEEGPGWGPGSPPSPSAGEGPEWDGEGRMNSTAEKYIPTIKKIPPNCLPAGIHQGELSRSNNMESRAQPVQ